MRRTDWAVLGAFALFVFAATYLNVTGNSDHYLLPFLVAD